MNILGLDLSSTCTGWAVLDYDSRGLVDCGTIAPRGELPERTIRTAAQVDQLLDGHAVGDVYLEAIGTRFVGTALALGMVHGAVLYVCESHGIDPGKVAPAQLKRHATGDGTSSKAAMIAAAQVRWPRAGIVLHDIADAVWLADYGCTDIERAVAE